MRSELSPGYRHLANPRAFEDFLDGGGALSGRDEVAAEHDDDYRARDLHFEEHLRSLVLLHASDYESARDLTWAAEEEDLLFTAQEDFRPKQLWRELQAAMHAAIFEFGRRCHREAKVSPEHLPVA